MAFAITSVQCYGQEAEEPLNKRYRQFMMLNITAANTDVDLDLGDNQTGSLGTFWDAVDGTTIGAGALQAIQDIVLRAQAFATLGGNFLDRAQVDPSDATITTYDSGASSGGSATESLTFTGMDSTDTILALTPKTAGANAAAIRAFGSPGSNSLSVTFTADPGANAVVRALVKKAAATTSPAAGTYTITYANKTPNILFASGDAPTSYQVSLEWVLQPQTAPVEYYATA